MILDTPGLHEGPGICPTTGVAGRVGTEGARWTCNPEFLIIACRMSVQPDRSPQVQSLNASLQRFESYANQL